MTDHRDQSDQPRQPDEGDPQLDLLLARSAPPVSTASPQVQQEVRALVRATAAAAAPAGATVATPGRRQRAGRRLALGAGAVVVAFAGVSAAAASPSAPGWLAWADWTPDATVMNTPGECALLGLKVVPNGARADDPAVVAAGDYLAGLDLEDVDYSRELVEQRESVVTLEDGTEVLGEDFHSDAHLEFFAYTAAINRMIYDEVERQGLDEQHVSIEGRGDGCSLEEGR